jgi:filamentous hemagglutinin
MADLTPPPATGVDGLKLDSLNISERGLGSTSGHQFATVTEGGSGQALAGHGVMESNATILGNGQYVSPPGTTVITPRPGIKISDSTGKILENVKSVEHLKIILSSGVGPNGQILVPRNFLDLAGYNFVAPG